MGSGKGLAAAEPLKGGGKSPAAIGVEIGVSRLGWARSISWASWDTEVVEISSKTTVDDVIHRSVAFTGGRKLN